MPPYPAVKDCDRIAAMPDPVVRNLCITQCYAELSAAFSRRFGPMANWCTFATWASKQAGQTIQGKDLERAFEQWLGTDPGIRDLLAETAAQLQKNTDSIALIREVLDPRTALQGSADAVARGNQKVFAEIGRQFAGFAASCLDDTGYDAEKIARFCADLRPGAPPDGQMYLQRAFTHYYQALFENDAKARAEYLLLANLEIGFHEQTRLQPEIAEALNAALPHPQLLARRIAGKLIGLPSWLLPLCWWILRNSRRIKKMDQTLQGFVETLRRRIRLFLTDRLMTLEFPDGRIALGSDLKGAFPERLQHIQNPELQALLREVDASPDSLRHTGTNDWAHLPERMHFIADLFRSYHEKPDLFDMPFTADQVAAFKERV